LTRPVTQVATGGTASAELHRQTARLRRYAALIAVLLGLILVIFGGLLGAATAMGAIFIGTGAALLASATYSAIFYWREDIAESFLQLGVEQIFVNRKENFKDSDWSALVRDSSSHVRVLGVANHGYIYNEVIADRSTDDFRHTLINNKTTVEIIWLKPDYEAAAVRSSKEKRDTIADITRSMIWFWQLREDLPEDAKSRLKLKEYEDIPYTGITWADNQLIITLYIAAALNLDSPGMVLRRSGWLSRFYRDDEMTKLYEQHYQIISKTATELSPERMETIREIQAQHQQGTSEAAFRQAGPAAAGDHDE
jgi:hypothetical protein